MDQETFICMVRQSQNTYYRVARSILSKEEDAEDAVQEETQRRIPFSDLVYPHRHQRLL